MWILLSSACVPTSGVTWFTAASTGPAAREVAGAFTIAHGISVQVSSASSSLLARQIDAGADADLFLSAHPTWADAVVDRTLKRTDLLTNEIVAVSRSDRAGWTPGDPPTGCVAVGDPDHVPIGTYAKAALTASGHWDDLVGDLVATVDAPAAVRTVLVGACPHALAYRTDATHPDLVASAPLGGSDIVYPLLLLSPDPDAAQLFAWIGSDEAAAIFTRHGFGR